MSHFETPDIKKLWEYQVHSTEFRGHVYNTYKENKPNGLNEEED